MPKTDHVARSPEPPGEDASPGNRRHRLRVRLQNWIARPDEQIARERGWTVTRSVSGLSVDVRSPRFDRRHACDSCAGTGRRPITGDTCAYCVDGVVTDPDGR